MGHNWTQLARSPRLVSEQERHHGGGVPDDPSNLPRVQLRVVAVQVKIESKL
jgi:hypothetical protein